jgi:hypothetical protein
MEETVAVAPGLKNIIYQQIYPGIIPAWWRLNKISGMAFLGVPIEELAWGFSWGLVAGPVYEFAAKLNLKT